MQKEPFAFRAGRFIGSLKPISPGAFAVGGIAGYFAFSMLGMASEMFASIALIVLLGALFVELTCRLKQQPSV